MTEPCRRRSPPELHITPGSTPTEASWLNLIEAHFDALSRATLTNTDDCDHASRRRRIRPYLRYRQRELRIGRDPLREWQH